MDMTSLRRGRRGWSRARGTQRREEREDGILGAADARDALEPRAAVHLQVTPALDAERGVHHGARRAGRDRSDRVPTRGRFKPRGAPSAPARPPRPARAPARAARPSRASGAPARAAYRPASIALASRGAV